MATSNPTPDTNSIPAPTPQPENTPSRFTRLYNKVMKWWYYCSEGVWRDRRNTFKVNAVKTANLTIRSFLDSDLQSTACAMTYRTVLAIVPALAMILAIFRGFGFQDQLMTQLYSTFPAQKQTLALAFDFVDRYLNQATEGLFVGIGIIFLLYTLISLLSSVEDSFNSIWQIKQGRTMWRKVTDYLAIFIVLPVLMICAGGIQVVMSSTLQKINFIPFIGESVKLILDGVSLALTWLFFAGAYMLIPNAKVKFINALLAGVAVGTAFHVIQWLFVTGQMYVTKYNAIYGSFSFLPLMLIWMQLTWLITLIGALLCY
ncbi:MAG: YihY/virulence factor BrkB family protein, partial [Paramuribaculum sp.]|nr:YihY/virulence factor BrkB family protein [Paramuribaculum sp.]